MKTKDLLTIWGYLESYKIEIEKKLRTLAEKQPDERTENLIADYTRNVAEIKALQKKIDDETINADFHCENGSVIYDN